MKVFELDMLLIVRAMSLENLVSVQIIFGNQPVGLSSRDAQLAETDSFFTKFGENHCFFLAKTFRIFENF